MKTFESSSLLNAPLRLDSDGSLHFGERVMPVSQNAVIELTDEHTEQIEQKVLNSLRLFGTSERTLAFEQTGLPTLVARADCTIDPESGSIHLYEAEERPAGMGVVDAMSKQLADRKLGAHILGHLEHTLGRLPVVKRHADVLENDDGMLLPVEVFTDQRMKLKEDRPILVRAEPHQMTNHPRLEDATSLAIAPILEKGKRAYRVATGDATILTNPKVLPEQSTVLKTLQGSKARGVSVMLSREDSIKHGNRDTVTRKKASDMIEREGAVIAEKFVPGIPVEMMDRAKGHMILRIFCLVGDEGAEAIGGAFLARPGHLIHGSRDAVSGLVLTGKSGS